MVKQTLRSALVVLLAALLGVSLYLNLSPDPVSAQEKAFQYIKTGEISAVKTVAVNAGDGRLVFVTGQTGMAPGKGMSEDIGEQADIALENLDRELSAAGLERTDVAKLTIYVKDLDLVEGGFVLRSVQTFFGGSSTPVITWVGVTSLLLPDALLEIEAMAVAAS